MSAATASQQIIAIVTGANQGLGRGLVSSLLRRASPDSVVYLGARNPQRGQQAVSELLQELGGNNSGSNNENDHDEMAQLKFLPIDVASNESVMTAADLVSKQENLDATTDTTNTGNTNKKMIFIHNAAARMSPGKKQQDVENVMNTNNMGTHRVIRHFAPLLQKHSTDPRFLIVASSFGSLQRIDNKELHPRFDDIDSLEDVETLMTEYTKQVLEGTDEANGWPEWLNIPSKVFQVASMHVLAQDWKKEGEEAKGFVAAICPGLVQTEASRPFFDADAFAKAPTPEQAAEPIVDLALQDYSAGSNEKDTFYGRLVQAPKKQVIPWN